MSIGATVAAAAVVVVIVVVVAAVVVVAVVAVNNNNNSKIYCILASCYIRLTLNICSFVRQCNTFTS
jgi:hypothetical protein